MKEELTVVVIVAVEIEAATAKAVVETAAEMVVAETLTVEALVVEIRSAPTTVAALVPEAVIIIVDNNFGLAFEFTKIESYVTT